MRSVGGWTSASQPSARTQTKAADSVLGRPDLAAEYFGRCIEIWDSLGETSFNSTMAALLALALCDAERFDDAERFVQRSRELSAEDDFASPRR